MKILFAVSEAVPFAASGGLADVGGSLPRGHPQPRERLPRGDAAL